ncbi:hydrogenase maturation protease [bacterium]|nr:hydrogenase maturation protease [bacterium]
MIVVLGLGNLLLGDEGVGIHALRLLEKKLTDPRVNYCDGGTQGLSLLPFLEEASYLLILDAVQADGAPGTIVELQEDQLNSSQVPLKFSAHDIALPDLLALLRFKKGSQIKLKLLGITPSEMEPSMDLSSPVSNSTNELVERAEKILESWLREEGGTYRCV